MFTKQKEITMDDLIKALQILREYGNPYSPTICEHDELYITEEINPENVSPEDIVELSRLGFNIDKELDVFSSFRFGSA